MLVGHKGDIDGSRKPAERELEAHERKLLGRGEGDDGERRARKWWPSTNARLRGRLTIRNDGHGRTL
jgi:hypothetical protein